MALFLTVLEIEVRTTMVRSLSRIYYGILILGVSLALGEDREFFLGRKCNRVLAILLSIQRLNISLASVKLISLSVVN